MGFFDSFITAKKPTPAIPEGILDLQKSIGSWTPTSSPKKRTRKDEKEEEQEGQESTPKKKRVVLSQLETPETTPIKQSSKISIVSNVVSKKLDFERPSSQPEQQPQAQELTPESTPKKAPKPPTPLEEVEEKENINPRFNNIYTQGKSLFLRSSKMHGVANLPAREKEAEALQNFITDHIITRQGTSLYLSGPPGTGKTAQTMLTLSQFVDTSKPHGGVQVVEVNGVDYKVGYTYINCMALPKADTVFSELLKGLKQGKCAQKEAKDKLYKLLSGDSIDMSVVVLDELDMLLQGRTDEVFTLFSWAVSCKICLVGISNALDMVDRLLPRLKMNGLSPNTLNFLPYTDTQIATIIKTKLATLPRPLFHPAAIGLCSKKAASHTGDLRKAFDICYGAIELTEREWRKNAGSLDPSEMPTVKIQQIAKVTNMAFNIGGAMKKLKSLNLQQKYLLCMLIRCDKKIGLGVNGFYELYIKHCLKNDTQIVGVLKKPEFLEVLGSLESNSLVRIQRSSKGFGESKLACIIKKDDLQEVVKGVYVLEKVLTGFEPSA